MLATSRKKTRGGQQDVKGLIMQTGLNLFTTRGYFNTSIHDIREKADISIGSIYHYFKGKEAIAKALYDDLVKSMKEEIASIIKEHESARSCSQALVHYLFRMTDQSPTIIEYMLHAKHREFMPDEPPFCSAKPFEMIKAMVEKGMARGEIRHMNPVVATTCLFGAAFRFIHLHLDGTVKGPIEPYADEIWENSWRGVAK
jgi:TetR/AcrR family transcriptional regulator, repressor of fatR-cypB operon